MDKKVIVFKTFKDLTGSCEISKLKQPEPTCINGNVQVELFEITIKKIVETDEVVRARLKTLWETENHHGKAALQWVGNNYGIDLSQL
jgi:hypothetical protein